MEINDEKLIDTMIDKKLLDVNTILPATIKSFDPATVTATVEVGFSKVDADGNEIKIKDLIEIPVMVLKAGGFFITMPIKAGDECLLLTSEREIDGWLEKGGQVKPRFNRFFNITDTVCLVGLQSKLTKVTNYDPDSMVIGLENGEATFKVNADGTIDVNCINGFNLDGDLNVIGDVNVDGDIVAVGDVVADSNGISVSLIDHTHTAGTYLVDLSDGTVSGCSGKAECP